MLGSRISVGWSKLTTLEERIGGRVEVDEGTIDRWMVCRGALRT
jgi:hypothetical protein